MDEFHWPEGFNVNMDDLPWLASPADVGFKKFARVGRLSLFTPCFSWSFEKVVWFAMCPPAVHGRFVVKDVVKGVYVIALYRSCVENWYRKWMFPRVGRWDEEKLTLVGWVNRNQILPGSKVCCRNALAPVRWKISHQLAVKKRTMLHCRWVCTKSLNKSCVKHLISSSCLSSRLVLAIFKMMSSSRWHWNTLCVEQRDQSRVTTNHASDAILCRSCLLLLRAMASTVAITFPFTSCIFIFCLRIRTHHAQFISMHDVVDVPTSCRG